MRRSSRDRRPALRRQHSHRFCRGGLRLRSWLWCRFCRLLQGLLQRRGLPGRRHGIIRLLLLLLLLLLRRRRRRRQRLLLLAGELGDDVSGGGVWIQ